MRNLVLLVFLAFFAGSSAGADAETDSLVRAGVEQFMDALQSGEGPVAAELFSTEAMAQVEAMLNTIKQSLRSDPEGTLRRLTSAGYQIELETARNWDPVDYLAQTLSLPMISARYIPYELRIDTVMVDRRRATVEMIFETASGAEIPQQALLDYEDDQWKVTSFMGITAFP